MEQTIIQSWQTQMGHNAGIVPDSVDGRGCHRFTIQRDILNPFVSGDRARSEILIHPQAEPQFGETWRYAFGLYVPSKFSTRNAEDTAFRNMSFMQLHGVPSGVNLQGTITGDSIVWKIEPWDEMEGKFTQKPLTTPFHSDVIVRDTWMDWAVDVKWSRNSDGFFKIYYGGLLRHEWWGLTEPHPENAQTASFKVGLQRQYFNSNGSPNFKDSSHSICVSDYRMERLC